jgi:hypothetical protein
LLDDAAELIAAHRRLKTGTPGRQYGLGSINRDIVIACVSAWEAYIEELVREALEAIRPPAPPLGLWPALNATVRGQLGRFNTPNVENVRMLISDALGLPDVQHSWTWPNCTSAQAVQRLIRVMELRHQIAHGVNPRPAIQHQYSSPLPGFFHRLALCTDNAVRHHLVTVHGIGNPWPP